MSILNRAARGAICILFAATLVGWGDSEADQRKAFIGFLQSINNRPGIHFTVPTATDEKAFGPYLAHYAIILDFNRQMNAAMNDFIAQLVKLGLGPNPSPRTIEQIAAAPADLTAAKDVVTKMEQLIETRLAKVNADRAALKQPDDLKTIYDKTFDKLVTAPTLATENSTKATSDAADATLALTTYLNTHRTKFVVSGMQIQAKDQRSLDEISAADEGVSGRRRACRRRAGAGGSGDGRELGRGGSRCDAAMSHCARPRDNATMEAAKAPMIAAAGPAKSLRMS